MYLKEIEITGFKSFADRINVNLDNNITCIVGPNGSGKSNIVDAIRFVLGEQSVKSLRGDKGIADVIFGGSKNRNPLNVASVTLTFDNADNYLKIPYNNVSVKRRLYKTGENEYFLNGEKCRLKDIVDLFLDSGMGRDSFNIISQGDIGKILSNSSLERRLVIEEAAGILKYKKRREEAFKKLDKTNINLDRITDIIKEVEERREPLKRQSEKALEYLDNKKKLENIEVALLTEEITDINLKYQEQKAKLETLNTEVITLSKKTTNPEIDELKVREMTIDKELDALNRKLVLITSEKEQLNTQILILKERSKYDADSIKVYENITFLKDQELSLQKEIHLLEKDLEDFAVKKKQLEDKLNIFIDELNDLKSKKEDLYKEYNYKNKELLGITNRIDILKNNLENNVYLNNNVRRVLDNPRLRGIYNAFGNVLNIESKYERCLDIAIQSTKNFIIVSEPDAAKEAISYLKENKLGRLTFLPLSVIKPKGIDYETSNILEKEVGYLGILSDFVSYEEIYKNIVLNQLGNIIIASTIDDANRISKNINNKYRIITLDGEVIHIGGSITGGSFNDTKSLISIKKEITDLELKENLSKNSLVNFENDTIKKEEEISNLDKLIYENRSLLISLIDNVNTTRNNLEDKRKKLNDITNELNTLDSSDLSSEEEIVRLKYYDKSLECDLLTKDIHNKSKDKELLRNDILELEAINKVNQSALSSKEKEIGSLELILSKMDNKLDNNLNLLNTEYNLTYERASLEYSLELSLEEAKEAVNKYKARLREIGMVNLDSIDEYKEVNERYQFLVTEKMDLDKAKEMLYSLIDEMDEVMEEEFFKTFKELQIEFKKVFKELFKGGDASLELTDPSNLLETGVDIIASPPGKRLKTVTLLSGGEKTLTAISLLFAILNIRSVPFCVFDEVEAALDEANVDNFGKYLHTYQDKTQFLLITHKKRTMEYAKTLYGITMQESGISKLVSVKLEDKDEVM